MLVLQFLFCQKAVLETIKNALKGVGGADEGPSGSIMDLRYGEGYHAFHL